jgi:hypothetical protein
MEALKADITNSARNFYGGAYCVDENVADQWDALRSCGLKLGNANNIRLYFVHWLLQVVVESVVQ